MSGGNGDGGAAGDAGPDSGPGDGDAGRDYGPGDAGRDSGPGDGGAGPDSGPGDGDAGPDSGPGDGGAADHAGSGTSAGATGNGGPADPGELLGEVRAIRRRARLARHAYWFPLVLFGLLTVASVPFYIRRFPAGPGVFAMPVTGHLLPIGFVGRYGIMTAEGSAYYWLGAMLLGLTATVFWYRWRGNRVGLRTPARGYLITGLVFVALALLIPVVSGRSVRLPLIWPGDSVIRGPFPLVLIGLGLCVLAWSERSTGLAAIAAGYLAISLVANLYALNNVLYRLRWNLSPAAAGLPDVVLPALVLLLSGAGAWVVQRRIRPPAESELEV